MKGFGQLLKNLVACDARKMNLQPEMYGVKYTYDNRKSIVDSIYMIQLMK